MNEALMELIGKWRSRGQQATDDWASRDADRAACEIYTCADELEALAQEHLLELNSQLSSGNPGQPLLDRLEKLERIYHALSPDPHAKERWELEARRDGIIFCRRSNWAKQDAELADLECQLAALEKEN
jgi:hypothetical protein